MATIEFKPYTLGQVLGHRVYAKQANKWSNAWQLQSHVHCSMASWRCAPSIGNAELYYRYGYAIAPGSSAAAIINSYSLPSLAYIKIEFDIVDYSVLTSEQTQTESVTTTRSWYGVVGTLIETQAGTAAATEGGTVYADGQQSLPAVGIEWLLERDYISESIAEFTNSGEIVTIPRAIGFNEGNKPNRNQQKEVFDDVSETFLYSSDVVENCEYWTPADVAEYLVNTFSTSDQKWKFSDPDDLLGGSEPVFVPTRNARRRELLNRLMPRQRGLAWFAHVNDLDEIEVRPITFSTTQITNAAGDVILEANPTQNELVMAADRSGRLQIATDAFQKYERIRVRGDRITYCFNASIDHNANSLAIANLEKGWTEQRENEYRDAASTKAGYPADNERAERERQNFGVRNTFDDVFQVYRLKQSWAENFNDDIRDPDDDTGLRSYWNGIRILPTVPIPKNIDTSVVLKTERGDDYRQPFAVFPFPGKANRFLEVKDLALLASNEGYDSDADNFDWSAVVVGDDTQAGFRLNVNGQSPHVVNGKNFTYLPDDPKMGQWDYTKAVFVIAIHGERYCETVYPEDSEADGRERLIDAGENYQLHWVAINTVLETTSQNTLTTANIGRITRDDRDELRSIAKLAYEWYGTERRSLQFETSLVTDAFELGDMITAVVDVTRKKDVNSVITEITITNGRTADTNPPPPRINYRTNFAELDFLAVSR